MIIPKVLISEDDPTLVRALAQMVRSVGMEPLISVGEGAFALAADRQPDLVLVDIHQPGFDGRNLLLQLKRNPMTAHIEVVVMSGMGDDATRNECLALGALAFIPKPFAIESIEALSVWARAAANAGGQTRAATSG